MKRCNKVKESKIKPKYYLKGINDESYACDLTISKKKLAQFDEKEVQNVISNLNQVTDVIQSSIDENHYVPMSSLRNELIEKKATKAVREGKGFNIYIYWT